MALHTKILLGMLVGVLLGLFLGPSGLVLPRDGVQLVDPDVVVRQAPAEDAAPVPLAGRARRAELAPPDGEASPEGFLRVRLRIDRATLLKLRKDGVEGAAGAAPGAVVTGWVPDDPERVEPYSTWGAWLVDATEWIGRLFLALIKMVVVPLVFLSLVVGVASLGDLRALGRLGSRTLGFFFVSTIVALTIGVGWANLLRPGDLLLDEDRDRLLRTFQDEAVGKLSDAADAPSFVDQLVGVVPTNPIEALATGEMLQIIVFASLLGVALTFQKGDRAAPVVDVFDRLNDAIVTLVHLAMQLAPYGVAALLFKVAGTTGPTVLLALLGYCAVVVLGLGTHLALTYGLTLTFLARLNPLHVISALKEALLVAFSTSSSSATLPVTKECVEENLNVSPKVASFVLPLGATVNMDGTALYQGVAAIFIAQIYVPEGLTLLQQGTIVGSATLASVGAAGVPGAGMITLVMVLTAIGIPAEGLALVLGVDRLLDMFRTMVNVTGDATATALVARLEGEDLRFLPDALDRDDPERGFEGRLDHGAHPVHPGATDPGGDRKSVV
jgi:proton glutamate symport protein